MKRSLLALTLIAALPAMALSSAATAAEGVSYNYVEGGYSATDTDFGDADGFAINGSAAVAPNFHLFGGYNGQTTDDFTVGTERFSGIDVDQWRLGVGYNHEISPRTDLLTRVAYERAEVANDNINGYSVEAGVRSALSPMIEGYALGDPATQGDPAKIAALYRGFMDEKTVDALGAKPLQPLLADIRAAKDKAAVATLMGQRGGMFDSFFNLGVSDDQRDPDRYTLYLSQGGLGLGDREMYLRDTFKPQRERYEAYIAQMLQLAGWDRPWITLAPS